MPKRTRESVDFHFSRRWKWEESSYGIWGVGGGGRVENFLLSFLNFVLNLVLILSDLIIGIMEFVWREQIMEFVWDWLSFS